MELVAVPADEEVEPLEGLLVLDELELPLGLLVLGLLVLGLLELELELELVLGLLELELELGLLEEVVLVLDFFVLLSELVEDDSEFAGIPLDRVIALVSAVLSVVSKSAA